MRVIPPRHHDWWDVLPSPYNQDQQIVLVGRPEGWDIGLVGTKDRKYQFGVMTSPQGTVRGLQVIDTDLNKYNDHSDVMAKYGVEMACPAYVGLFSAIPDNLLLNHEVAPMVFCRAAMWRNFIDLQRCWNRSELKC